MNNSDAHPADAALLAEAVLLASDNVVQGGGPFGALVARDGIVIARGQNRTHIDLDPTAHAEIVAIRNACGVLNSNSLEDTVLYTSCEPCPLCMAGALWAHVDRVVFAADRHDAASYGFDDEAFYEFFAGTRNTGSPRIEHMAVTDSLAPFERWKNAD